MLISPQSVGRGAAGRAANEVGVVWSQSGRGSSTLPAPALSCPLTGLQSAGGRGVACMASRPVVRPGQLCVRTLRDSAERSSAKRVIGIGTPERDPMESQQQNGHEQPEPDSAAKQVATSPLKEVPRGCLSHLLRAGGWGLLLLTVLDLISGLAGKRLMGLPLIFCFVAALMLLYLGKKKKYVLADPSDRMIKGAMLVDGPYVGDLFLIREGVLFQARNKDLSADKYGIEGGALYFLRREIGSFDEKSSLEALGKVVEIVVGDEEQKYQFKMNAKKRRELLEYLSKQNGRAPTR